MIRDPVQTPVPETLQRLRMQRYKGDCLLDYKCSVYFVKKQ
jgi:hypothetical protein